MTAAGNRFTSFRARRATFALRRRLRFYDKMGRFTRNGVPLISALRNLHGRYVKYKDVRAGLFVRMVSRLEEGDHISQVLGSFVPAGERLLIQSGEESGKIHEGFFQAKRLAEVLQRLRAALMGELAYPALLFILLCAMLSMVAWKLVPVLTTAVPLSKWPPFAVGLHTLSEGVVHFGPFIIVGIAAAVFLSIRSLPGWRGPVRENLDRWCPPWTIYREIQGSSFLIALAALTGSGQSVTTSIERLGISGSPWLSVHLKRMLRTLLTGSHPGEAMRTGLFVREVEDDIEDYSRTANFEDALERVGVDQTEEAIERIKARAAVLRNVLLVVVLGVLLYVYAAAAMVAVSVASEAMSATK